MRQLLIGALLGVLALAFGHPAVPLAASALSHVAAQPIAIGFALGALSRLALTRRSSS